MVIHASAKDLMTHGNSQNKVIEEEKEIKEYKTHIFVIYKNGSIIFNELVVLRE